MNVCVNDVSGFLSSPVMFYIGKNAHDIDCICTTWRDRRPAGIAVLRLLKEIRRVELVEVARTGALVASGGLPFERNVEILNGERLVAGPGIRVAPTHADCSSNLASPSHNVVGLEAEAGHECSCGL